jgi:hypothetical protein
MKTEHCSGRHLDASNAQLTIALAIAKTSGILMFEGN